MVCYLGCVICIAVPYILCDVITLLLVLDDSHVKIILRSFLLLLMRCCRCFTSSYFCLTAFGVFVITIRTTYPGTMPIFSHRLRL